MGGTVMTKLLFRLEICSKIAGIQENFLSNHRMTTGFGPFELLPCGPLQRVEELSGGAPTLLCSSKLLFVDARLA